MSLRIKKGADVFVPRKLLSLDLNNPSPFYKTTVTGKNNRSVRVKLPDGEDSEWIATSKVSLQLGVLIVRIGDFQESQLIDPLFKSVLHFCRILLPDDHIKAIEIRTIREFVHFWKDYHSLYQQIVFIGHGSEDSIIFGSRAVRASRLIGMLGIPNPQPKEFISLCCNTGYQSFGKPFSISPSCEVFIAPFHSIHGCIASQFCQNYLTLRLLDNQSIGVAFNNARKHLIGAASFRHWQNGKLKAGQR